MIGFEIKKIFSKTGSKVGLLVLLVILVASCYFAVTYNVYVDENGKSHTGIAEVQKLREEKEKWAGLITEDYLKAVIRENKKVNIEYSENPADVISSEINYSKKQGFWDLRTLINSAFSPFRGYNPYLIESISEGVMGSFYENRIQGLKEWLAGDGADQQFTEKEKAFLIMQYESLETPFYYEPADGWMTAIVYVVTIIMMTMLVLGFFVSGIFSNEFQWKADSIFFSTRYGRNKGTLSKMAAGFIVITAIYWLMIGVYSFVVFGIYGTGGADCIIQTTLGGWKSLYHMTLSQEYLVMVVGGYIGTLFILLLSMLVSAKTRSAVVAVTIPFSMMFIQSFFGGIPALRDVLGLLPDQLLQLNTAVSSFALYEIGGKVVASIPLLFAIYSVLSVVLLPVMYYVYRKAEL